MFNVLQARGVPSKFLMFPDEHHVSHEDRYHGKRMRAYMLTASNTVGAQAGEFSRLAQGGVGLDQQVQWDI